MSKRLLRNLIMAGATILGIGLAAPAQAQEVCLGSLMLFGGPYCPQNYTEADGKLLSIPQNAALFSVLGTQYGGNGSQTFAVPDLRGRAPVGQGQGPGLPSYAQGTPAGSPTTTLTTQNLPAHSHSVNALRGSGDNTNPAGALLGTAPASAPIYGAGAPGATMSQQMIGLTGNGQPVTTQSPIQAIRWCVAVSGIYCSRQ